MGDIRNVTGEIIAVIGVIIGMIGNWYDSPIAIVGLVIGVVGIAIIIIDIVKFLRDRPEQD